MRAALGYFLVFPVGLAAVFAGAAGGGLVTVAGGAAMGALYGTSIFLFALGHRWLKGHWPHQPG